MPIPGTQSTWAEQMKWMDTADPNEVYAEASRLRDSQALTICSNLLIRSDLSKEIRARTYLLSGIVKAELAPADALHHLASGIQDARGVIDQNDPDLLMARSLHAALKPKNPDWDLVSEYWTRLDDHLAKTECTNFDLSKLAIAKKTATAWSTLHYVMNFDSHVQVNGLSTYFANRLDDSAVAITEAFKRVDKKIGAVIEEAFQLFETKRQKHVTSHDERDSTVRLYDMIRAGQAPGRYDGDDEDYEKVESKYLKLSDVLLKKLAQYINKHLDEFNQLPVVPS